MESDKKTHQQTTYSAAIKMRNGQWARSNIDIANIFSEHLAEVFKILSRDVSQIDIRSLNPNKLPGYDLITKYYLGISNIISHQINLKVTFTSCCF